MRVGIPRESAPGETRVAAVPDVARKLSKKGIELVVESGAGELSHVPDDRFDAFWRAVRAALRADGRVFLIDNVAGDPMHAWKRAHGHVETRSVADGREFDIVKRHWEPEELEERVRPLGFDLDLRGTANGHFLYGGSR